MSDNKKEVIQVSLTPFKGTWGFSKSFCMGLIVMGGVYLTWMPWVSMSWFVVSQILCGLFFLTNEYGYDLMRRDSQEAIIRLAGGCHDFNILNKEQEAQIKALTAELSELTDSEMDLREEVVSLKTRIQRLSP